MSTKKLIKRPDHDPNNPYHYHDTDGNKIVITPEDWEANVGKPYFREIEDAVRAEQAAYPEPEYEINPNFVRDLRSTYAGNMGYGYQNYRNFQHNLPQGYSFTPEGVIIGPDGTAYVQSGYRQTPRFTYSTDNPLQFTINQGKPIERNLTFYPVNMNRRVKAPLPIDRTLDVGKEYENAINNYMNNNQPVKTYYRPFEVDQANNIIYIYGSDNALSSPVISRKNGWYGYKMFPNSVNAAEAYAGENPITYEELLNAERTYNINNPNQRFALNWILRNDFAGWSKRPSRQEAEKKAVIEIGPLERVKSDKQEGKLIRKTIYEQN